MKWSGAGPGFRTIGGNSLLVAGSTLSSSMQGSSIEHGPVYAAVAADVG
jgi:hypothetical protein